MARSPGKPPYVVKVRGRWYWQPRGRMRLTGPPCELGEDQTEAFAKGWQIYNAGINDLKQPSASPNPYTVSWGAAEWRNSDHYSLKASGKPKASASIKWQETGLKVLEELHGKHDLRAFNRRAAQGLYQRLRTERGDSMANGVLRLARMLFNWFVDQGYRADNPFLKQRLYNPPGQFEHWNPDRVRLFFDKAIEMDRRVVGTYVLIAYETAQNPKDILRWRWSDIKGGVHTSRSKTGGKAFIPLSEWCLAELEALSKTAVQLFVSQATKRPYKYDHMAKEVRRIAREAGLPDSLQVRAFRYEAPQQAIDGGAGRGDVQSLMAHKSPGTQDYYADRRDATKAQDARKLWKDE